jgi:uncharacterized protein YdeI (YjbR/CyaY-like superfamily)
MQPGRLLYVTNREEWRTWLKENHETEKEIWLVFFKKNSGKPGIIYEDAVEEAICFGWIDSLVKKIDDQSYSQKFTPRTVKAGWSVSNKIRAERMIQQGRMTQAGLDKIREAKENGNWEKTPERNQKLGMK